MGSSPRGRGKRHHAHEVGQGGRLIPARAGKTATRRAGCRSAPAHPRAGGENALDVDPTDVDDGSSPRGRGKRGGGRRTRRGGRLIPARAGKTRCQQGRDRACPAHPRAGGENARSSSPRGRPRGSSPRGRGKLFPAIASSADDGLIPARAGKTRSGPPGGCERPAHPRAGGENSL